jgi:hypothetical protein
MNGGFRGGALYSASFDLGTQLLFKHLDHGAPPAVGVAPSLHLLLRAPKMSHQGGAYGTLLRHHGDGHDGRR